MGIRNIVSRLALCIRYTFLLSALGLIGVSSSELRPRVLWAGFVGLLRRGQTRCVVSTEQSDLCILVAKDVSAKVLPFAVVAGGSHDVLPALVIEPDFGPVA